VNDVVALIELEAQTRGILSYVGLIGEHKKLG